MRNYSSIIGSPAAATDLRQKNQMAMPTAEFNMGQILNQSHQAILNGGSERKVNQINNILQRQAILQQQHSLQDKLEPIRANPELEFETGSAAVAHRASAI